VTPATALVGNHKDVVLRVLHPHVLLHSLTRVRSVVVPSDILEDVLVVYVSRKLFPVNRGKVGFRQVQVYSLAGELGNFDDISLQPALATP
jgi:hypothetical protein